ncbi:WD-40 repeat protein, partial [Reticulomyxa filosa]
LHQQFYHYLILNNCFLSICIYQKEFKRKNEKKYQCNYHLYSEEDEIQTIIHHWIRILNIKLGWIQDFNKLVIKYANFFMLDLFRSSSKLLNTFNKRANKLLSIDYSTFGDCQFICSGSNDSTVRLWDIETNQQIQSFNGHSGYVHCVKFSRYHQNNSHCNVICSSSRDKTIRFWDVKNNQQLKLFNGHTSVVFGIEFSSFNSGRYLCSVSYDKTIRLWDVEMYKPLHVFNGYKAIFCVDISPLQSNNNDNDNKMNNIGVIGGNGYTICSGSLDKTIRIWDIETAKEFIVFKGHNRYVSSVKYASNELGIDGGANTILSGSADTSVRLWDIRSGEQIQVFNGHTHYVCAVEYSPFVINNNEASGCSNVICSGSRDNTIRFWDIRSNKKELYIIQGDDKEHDGVQCFKFIRLKKIKKTIMIVAV